MSERNIGNPHIGHRRFPIGGAVGLKLCGCGMARIPPTDTGNWSLSHLRARPRSVMLASDVRL